MKNSPNTSSSPELTLEYSYKHSYATPDVDFVPDRDCCIYETIAIGDEIVYMPRFLIDKEIRILWVITEITDDFISCKDRGYISTSWDKKDLKYYLPKEIVLKKYAEYIV